MEFGQIKNVRFATSKRLFLFLSDIEDILKKSRDYDELVHVWESWRKNFKPSRKLYEELVQLLNEVAVLNGNISCTL